MATIWSARMLWPRFVKPTNTWKFHDQELVVVKADSVEVQDYDGNVKEQDSYTAELDLSDIGKGLTHTTCLKKSMSNQLSCVS